MPKQRLDHLLVARRLVTTRSQAESYIRLGKVQVNGRVITKPGYFVAEDAALDLKSEQYVSRAALKLGSVAEKLQLSFRGKAILDVGSSTGGFTDYALKHGATKSIAVDVGTYQLHPTLRADSRIELHERTDIRDMHKLSTPVQMVVIDVSFISLRDVLPHIAKLVAPGSQIVAMVKPQFEAGSGAKHKGVIKNDTMRRQILKDFETWARQHFVVLDKADSDVSGEKGNQERFYLLQKGAARS
jgi:23S rRNA (cytidine1920-2'-O)/16S rRNA (cytidine1409-2'-O)-methyltransferase